MIIEKIGKEKLEC